MKDVFERKRLRSLFIGFMVAVQALVTGGSAAAEVRDRLRIEATMGDSTVHFEVADKEGRPVILHHSNSSPERGVEITRKDQEFFIAKGEELLELVKTEPLVRDSSSCPREFAWVELRRHLKDPKKGLVCIKSGSKPGRMLLRLIEVLGADF